METPLRKENDSDKIKNHLSVFHSFDELILEEFENKDYIACIYRAMKNSNNELANLLKHFDEVENFNKFSVAVLLLENYFDGYKTAEEVLAIKDKLKIKKIIDDVLSVIKNAPLLT